MHALGCWAAAFLRSGPHASRWDPSSVLSSIIELLLLIKLPHLLLLGLTIGTYTCPCAVQEQELDCACGVIYKGV